MPDGNRHHRHALIALGLALAAIVLLAWLGNPAGQNVGQPSAEHASGRQGDPVEPAGFWRTHTTPQDTYAQWVMAAFTIVATGLSLYAVRLVRDTLRETRRTAVAAEKGVEEATRLGEMQLRAYLIIKRVSTYFVFDGAEMYAVKFELIVTNGGDTPAVNIGKNISITEAKPNVRELSRGSSKRSVIAMDMQSHIIDDIAPGGDRTLLDIEVPISSFKSFESEGRINCNLRCELTYQPVVSADPKRLIANYWIRGKPKGFDLTISRSGPNETT